MGTCNGCGLHFAAGAFLALGWMCLPISVGLPALSDAERGAMIFLGLVYMIGAIVLMLFAGKVEKSIDR